VLADLIAAAQGMEQGAKGFQALGEEGLRQVLVAALRPRFGGLVTAESLNAGGKTDLLVRDLGGANIFVGECKVWGGLKALVKALEQLLGYATQADQGLGLILFVRTKNLTRVIGAARNAFNALPAIRSVTPDPLTERVLRVELDHPQDPDAAATVSTLFIALPNERSEELGGEVQDEGGVAELAGIGRDIYLSGNDSGLRYQVQVLSPDEPAMDPGPDVLVREERAQGPDRVVIDVEAMNKEAADRFAVTGKIIPREDEQGIRAQMLIAEAIKWHVGVEVHGGLEVAFDTVPPALAAGVEELKRGSPGLVLEPQSDWSWPVELHVETDRGEARVDLSMFQVPAEEGWSQTLRGSFHNLSISLNLGGGVGETQVRWRLHPTDASVADRLAALDFLYASSGEGKLTWTSRTEELPSTETRLSGDEDFDESIVFERAFFGDIVALGEWLGRDFDLPSTVPQLQILEIASAAALVRAGGGPVRWGGSTWKVPQGQAEIGETIDQLEIRLPVDVEIFGERLALGSGATKINAVVEAVEPIDEEWVAATLSPREPGDSVIELTALQPPTGEEKYMH
jgi:hypothetical protein